MFEELESKKEKKDSDVKSRSSSFSLFGLNNTNNDLFLKKEAKRIAPPPPALTDFDVRMSGLEVKGKKRGRRNMLIGTIGGAVIALIVMCFLYFLAQDVNDISDKIDRDISEMPDLSNRKKNQESKIIKEDDSVELLDGGN